MKNKHLLLYILFFPTIILNAQESQSSKFNSKHEISIIADNVFAKNNAPLVYTNQNGNFIGYYPSEIVLPEMGLGYKFHLQSSAIRLKLSGVYKDGKREKDNSNYKRDETYFSSTIALGYELHKNIGNTQFFYGLDIYIKSTNQKSKYTRNDYYLYNTETYTSEDIINYEAYGISPLLGIKLYLNPSFSLSTILKYNILSYNEKHINKRSTSDEDSKYNENGITTKFGPLGQISFNIHL